MVRKIIAIVVGYLVMFVLVFATFTGAYAVLGAEGAFKPGSYDVTGTWAGVSVILSFVAAVAGGWVAARIGRGGRAAVLLAVVVVLMGIVFAIPNLNAPKTDEVRTADVSNSDAMMKARQPAGLTLLTPVIGALGVLTGARLRRGR
jgi:hypothetical protein